MKPDSFVLKSVMCNGRRDVFEVCDLKTMYFWFFKNIYAHTHRDDTGRVFKMIQAMVADNDAGESDMLHDAIDLVNPDFSPIAVSSDDSEDDKSRSEDDAASAVPLASAFDPICILFGNGWASRAADLPVEPYQVHDISVAYGPPHITVISDGIKVSEGGSTDQDDKVFYTKCHISIAFPGCTPKTVDRFHLFAARTSDISAVQFRTLCQVMFRMGYAIGAVNPGLAPRSSIPGLVLLELPKYPSDL